MAHPKESIQKCNLYLSHTWNHDNAYRDLKSLLGTGEGVDYIPYLFSPYHPINGMKDERKLYETIKGKMKFCDAVILLCGVYPEYSRWVNKELIACKDELQKPLIAVERYGVARTSLIEKENADIIVEWNAEAIIRAIKNVTRP